MLVIILLILPSLCCFVNVTQLLKMHSLLAQKYSTGLGAILSQILHSISVSLLQKHELLWCILA